MFPAKLFAGLQITGGRHDNARLTLYWLNQERRGVGRYFFLEGLQVAVFSKNETRRKRPESMSVLLFVGHGDNGNRAVVVIPGAGDALFIAIIKPFRSGDVYEFTTIGASVDQAVAKTGLDEIIVVPNPYVASASWESRLPPGIISGRGERKIQFSHLPSKCTIRIYSVRGYLVDTLEHDQPLNDGTEFWDLKSKDGMDIAYGLYFYHVEAGELVEMMGKFAVIK